MDSDEEETFITIGTAQDIPSEDEPLRKPLTQQDLQAKDNKGRARFHGAFTGGFSAGYFNSVGSKEGWAPSTFISSREKRAEHGQQQRPEDFMDDADVGEFGIAPRKVVTASTFASEERKRRRHDEAKLATSASALPSHSALLDLIVPERITIGVKLLRKMGWKEGQGVGPRLKKKEKRKKRAGMKTYGCEPPPSPDSDADDGLDDETFLSDVTFAPEDTSHISLSAKDNTHGLGYRGLNPQMALPSTHINLFEAPTVRKAGTRKGIRGQGFGVGALEEEDEDIYAADDMSRYDMTMGDDEEDNNFGWTPPSSKGRGNTPVGYVGKLLEGFKLSSTKLVQKKDFPPPQLPRNYRPVHVFKKPDESEQLVPAADRGVDYRQFLTPTYNQDKPIATPTIPPSTQSSNQPKQYKDAVSRSLALGEKAFVGSVFDLIPKEDKEKMERVKTNDASTASASSNIPSSAGKVPRSQVVISPPEPSQIPIEEQRRQNVPLFQSGGTSFKPFAKNPEKQERYEKYLALMKQGHRDPYSGLNVPAQTEWEGEREKEEFAKAALLYKPLTGMMAMRFTTGKQTDDDTNADLKLDESDDLSEADKAAQMKMYGKLTREVVQWHPDRLLCKRFNVPDPYPGSNIVGLATVKRDKYSVFTFLNFENPTSSEIQTIENSSSQKQELSKDHETNIETETDKTESRVDKELNKSKNMKSIFSHLVDTENKVQKVTKGVSFSMKSTKTNNPKEFKSIFSHLEEEGGVSSVKKYVAMNTGENNDKTAERDVHEVEVKQEVKDISEKKATDKVKENKKDKKEDKGSDSDGSKLELDLFHAIFKNTDSEDSSSSEEEEIASKKKAGQDDVGTTVPDVNMSVGEEEEDNNRRETASVIKGKLGLQTLPENYSNSILERLPPAQHNRDCDSYGPTLPPLCTSGRVGLGTLPGDDVKIESIADRLSPASHSSDSESYGPALPPPFTAGKLYETTTSSTFPSSTYIDLTQESSRKHRHKDKHKLKKDKKEKHKKGKHKKKQKKKERKKRKRNDTSNSSDTSDKDSDDEEPNDKELLNKLKTLKSRQRLRAVDFM